MSKYYSSSGLALVQLLALVTMAVDHLGALTILGDWSRVVGRFALPAFVVMIACNALAVSSPGRMAWRCAVLLLLSQPLWWLSVGSWDRLCILVTLLAVVLLVWSWRLRWPLLGVLVLVAFLVVSPWVEYRAWPLLLLPVILAPSWPALVLALVWPLVQYPASPLFQVAALVSLALVVILLRVPYDVPRLPRCLSRWFYPGHLLIIAPF